MQDIAEIKFSLSKYKLLSICLLKASLCSNIIRAILLCSLSVAPI